jgi:hypothetical protein
MPGMAVHGPLIVASTLAGFLLCWPHGILRPLLALWVLAGLYLGRDIAILCHYSPLLTLLSWAASGFVLFKPGPIANFGRSHIMMAAALSGGLGVVLFGIAVVMTREKGSVR